MENKTDTQKINLDKNVAPETENRQVERTSSIFDSGMIKSLPKTKVMVSKKRNADLLHMPEPV